jgi:hypothetical protein
MASLTEAAKAVLEGKVLEEGIPTVGSLSGGTSNPNPVDNSTASTSNAKTLKPKSKASESDPKHNEAEDLDGATPTSTAKENLGAKAADKKDSSKSSHSSVSAEPTKALHAEEAEEEGMTIAERVKALKEAKKEKAEKEDEEEDEKEDSKEDRKEDKKEYGKSRPSKKEEDDELDEEIELSEELEDFINEGIELGLSEEEILAAIEENFEFVTEEETVDALENYQVDMAEHVNALLEGEDLSEEFHAKATTIFEAAVKAKLEEEVALLEQAYAETLEEKVAEICEQLTSDVDNYLNYVVEQWIEENEVAIESALRSELTEDFISGLRALCAEHYIDIPEEKVAVVEELSQALEETESRLNEEIQRNVELTGMIAESRKSILVSQVCEGLTDTQEQKLQALAENVEYNSDEEFINKIETLKESYFPVAVKSDAVLDTLVESTDQQSSIENLDGRMALYAKALGRSLPK